MFIQGFAEDYLATNTTSVALDDENSVAEGTELHMRCKPNTFREDVMEFNDTYVDSFFVQCSNDGSWSGLDKCSYPLCDELMVDAATVKETIWGSKNGSKVLQGSILKLECLEQGSTFETDDSVSRFFFECDKKKWTVSDTSLCPNNENSCKEPVKLSCAFTGCLSLPASFQNPVVYDPLLTSYPKGSSLTISCSNQVNPMTQFQAYSNDREYLVIKKLSQENEQQDNPDFCCIDNSLKLAEITWQEEDVLVADTFRLIKDDCSDGQIKIELISKDSGEASGEFLSYLDPTFGDNKQCFVVKHHLCGPDSTTFATENEFFLTFCEGGIMLRQEFDYCGYKYTEVLFMLC